MSHHRVNKQNYTPTPAQYAALVEKLLASALPAGEEALPLMKAGGRIAAENIHAPADLPAFANSQMDGYALTGYAASRSERIFTVGDDIPAGAAPASLPIDDNLVYPIMTGAPLPAGYSCVVPEEAAWPLGKRQGTFAAAGSQVRLPHAEEGQFVRLPGEDTRAGQLLIPAGTPLTPVHLATLASQGITSVTVKKRPRALILTGGDEITTDQPPAPGQLYDANGPMLTGLLTRDGAEVETAHMGDHPGELCALLDQKIRDFCPHLIVSSGGISHGKYEVVRQTLEKIQRGETSGLTAQATWFGHVSQQPGGPQGYARIRDIATGHTATWLALPGNPVSTLVSYTRFLRLQLCPQPRQAQPRYGVLITEQTVAGLTHKTQYRRGTATVVENPNGSYTYQLRVDEETGSHLLHRASKANALIEIEAGSQNPPHSILRWYPL